MAHQRAVYAFGRQLLDTKRVGVAVGETVILLTPLFIPIETPTKVTGGCHQMTVSPTARSGI